ncbi:MAG: hypothetical protein IPL53_14545 [Ignavibacteria bacterium]|nr:hypothetical protein [Ignavibacteria bacterium]
MTKKGGNLFAGTSSFGVYISTNGGANWTQTSLNNRDILSMSSVSNYIYAGTNGNGVYYSSNDGQSWVQSSLSSSV